MSKPRDDNEQAVRREIIVFSDMAILKEKNNRKVGRLLGYSTVESNGWWVSRGSLKIKRTR